MCPDGHVLSAFFDGELDRRSEAEVLCHVESCSTCSRRLAEFGDLRDSLADLPVPDGASSRSDALRHIRIRHFYGRRVGLWNRTIRVPLPIAAAAATLFILLGVGLLISIQNARRPGFPGDVSESHVADSGVLDLESLVRYFDSRGAGVQMTFTLPSASTPGLRYSGEPILMRAADYRGSD